MGELRVRTSVGMPRGWRWGLIIACGLPVVPALVVTLPDEPVIAAAVVALVLLALLPVVLMRVVVTADAQGVRAALVPMVRRRFRAADITEVAPVEGRGGVMDGMGLRYLGPRQWALVVGGPAVRITLRDGSSWVVSTPEPEKVTAAAAAGNVTP